MAQTIISLEDTRKMQLKGLEMALFFDSFCKEHGLTYFMCGGCCIGSIRNKGFIPWDDDVDVFMPRKDYEALKLLWKDNEDYSIQYPSKDLCTENQFLTICANKTTFIKTYQMNLDINHGLVLDVLPLDACPTGISRKIQKLWALVYSLFVVGKAPENHGKAVYTLGKIALSLARSKKARYRIWRFAEKQMSKYDLEKCKFITELCSGPHYMQNEYPKEFFKEELRVDFEGYQLPIPCGYDGYLKMAFGDYIKLPPKEKQVCHHEFEVMDMDNPYTKYRGINYFVNNKKEGK